MPMYQLGLHPKLHRYTRPVLLPNATEHVTGYCRHAEFVGSACEAVGRERKPSVRPRAARPTADGRQRAARPHR
eukprot:2823114-Prymnesium_polylepis.1